MKTIRMLSLLGCLTVAAFGQATEQEVANMKMWPGVPVKWLGSTDFDQINYGYYLDNSPSVAFTGAYSDWNKWRFAIYGGLTGKSVTYWADWGNPSGEAQLRVCGHTHVVWSSWLQFGYYSGGVYYTGWTRGAGGSMAGVKPNAYTCTMSTQGFPGWGSAHGSFKFPKTGNPFLLLIVGASAVSHGALGCSTHGCVNNPEINAFGIRY